MTKSQLNTIIEQEVKKQIGKIFGQLIELLNVQIDTQAIQEQVQRANVPRHNTPNNVKPQSFKKLDTKSLLLDVSRQLRPGQLNHFGVDK